MRASIFRQPRYESGFWVIVACDTGSASTPTTLGPAEVVTFGPRRACSKRSGWSALQVGASTSSIGASWFKHRVIAAVTSKDGAGPAPVR